MIKTTDIMGYRFYVIDGQYFPSVTSILSIRRNEVLEQWKHRLTLTQVRLIQEWISLRGTFIHYGALRTYETDTIIQKEEPYESYNYMKVHPQMREEVRIAGQLFREFKQKYTLTPVALEKTVWSIKYGFAGTIDCLAYLYNKNNGSKTPIIADIKTSKEIYTDSLALQLAGYNLAIQMKARKCFVLLLHPGQTTLDGVTIGRDAPYWAFQEITPNYQGFLELVRIFQLLKVFLLQYKEEQESLF
ncbi:MAG: hypothetical protein ACFFDT_04915 [Candidatus Hodarchaeota archaeon]